MDFEVQLDAELEGFREEVRAWLGGQVPPGDPGTHGGGVAAPEVREWAVGFQRRLAGRGWAAPSWPRDCGGGGLSPDHDAVVREELHSSGIPLLYESNRQVAAAILAWGGEEQRRRFVPPLLRGDVIAWRALGEADAVADPDVVSIRAVRDGDFYIVSGEDAVFGGQGEPTYIWTLAQTDPSAPSHERLGAFLIPADLPGVSFSSVESILQDEQRAVRLDGVRVPLEYRVGDEDEGWMVAQSSLEGEEETERAVREQEALVGRLVEYCRVTLRGRKPLFLYERVRQRVAAAYINAQVLRLVALRNRWMRSSGQEITFHGAQYSLLAKSMRVKLASTMLDTMGPFALLDDPAWAPMNGEAEAFQRKSLPGATPGEGIAMQERLMGSRLGLHRAREGDAGARA